MPAAAVIPAPIAYIKVVAVKKLVVGFQADSIGPLDSVSLVESVFFSRSRRALNCACRRLETFTLSKLECSKQAVKLE